MKEKIMQRKNCTEQMAAKLESKLSKISPELQPILDNWLENGVESSDEMIHGYSVNSLMEKYGLAFTGALLTLDWLLREPETAAAAIEEGIK
ncbi:MAG: hypothetical protein IKE65_02345 [Clostridia bacterium]|nr:hypothetical protein [Clostridia bacterium]